MSTANLTEVPQVAGRDAAADALVDLMRDIAHELNNQLATILGKSEIAMMVDDPARWKGAVEESHKAGQRARVLVADFQKLHAWFREPGASPAPLSDVIGLLRRICERRLSRSAVILEPAHAPSRALDDPVRVFLLLWLVTVEALERGGGDISATWTLAGRESAPRGEWSLEFTHPGAAWDAAARGLDARDALREGASRYLVNALCLAQELGADLSLEHERAFISFPS